MITKTDLVNSGQLVGSIVKRNIVNGKNNILTTWEKFDSRGKCWLQVASTLMKISAQAVETSLTSNANSTFWYLSHMDNLIY